MNTLTLGEIQAQRDYSASIEAHIGAVIRSCYRSASVGQQIGSYYRGTNVPATRVIDLDLEYGALPHDARQGYHDWTSQPADRWTELTDAAAIRQIDPVLWQAISDSAGALLPFASAPAFQWVRSGGGMRGVVYSIRAALADQHQLELDVTVSYEPAEASFAVEHTRRFLQYLETTKASFGETRAVQLVLDIRRLKQLTKEEASLQGIPDKTRKVPGFIIEGLFTHTPSPVTFEELITLIDQHAWPTVSSPALATFIQNQQQQLIGTGESPQEVLLFVTRGGYTTLKRIAARERLR